MPILSEEIAKRVKGPMAENEDWWTLCYDTEAQRFFVRHKWDHVKINGLTQSTGSSDHDAETWAGEGAAKIAEAKERLLDQAKRR